MPITVGAESFAEGVDLDVDWFYAQQAEGVRVTTSQPSPGAFATAYADHPRVLSLHLDGRASGTVDSALLAARSAAGPVRVVDTQTASFGVGICVIEAARALARGASEDDAVELVEAVAGRIGNVFVAADAPGGRVPAAPGLPIFAFDGGRSQQLGDADTLEAAAAALAEHVLAQPASLRVAVGHAAGSTEAAADRLAALLERADAVVELLRYRVGPSVGAHTGGESFGAFWWPAD